MKQVVGQAGAGAKPMTAPPVAKVPGPSPLGHLPYLPAMLGSPYNALLELQRRYGPVCRFGYGKWQYTLMFGREANELLMSNSRNFLWRDVLSLLIPVVGNTAMVVSDGADHRRRRRLVRPAFATKRIVSYVPIMVDEINAMIDAWQPGRRVDLFQQLRACIRRIAVRCLFGEHLRREADEVGRELDSALRYVNRSPFIRFDHDLPGTAYRRAMASRRHVDEFVYAEIARRRASRGEDGGDVLAALLAAQDEEDGLTDEEVRDQVVSLTSSGYDSSSAAASWAAHVLLTNPRVYERVRAEAKAVLGDDPLTADHLAGLRYTECMISEVLRLYTPGVLTGRKAVDTFDFAGCRIPGGSLLLYSQYVTHRLPQLWPDPAEFKPERWDTSLPGYREPEPFSYVPFGGAYRRCIGYAFALRELKVVIAELVRRAELVPVRRHIEPLGVATMLPRGGVPATVVAVRPAAGQR